MTKILKILLAIFVLLIILVSVLWFYQKSNIEKSIKDIESKLIDNDVKYSYKNYKITGFPLKHTISFEDINISVIDLIPEDKQDDLTKYEVAVVKSLIAKTEGDFVVDFNYISKTVAVKLPTVIDVSMVYEGEEDQNYLIKTGDKSVAKVEFKKHLSLILGEDFSDYKDLPKLIKSLSNVLNDFKVVDLKSNEQIYSLDYSIDEFNLNKLADGATKYHYKSSSKGVYSLAKSQIKLFEEAFKRKISENERQSDFKFVFDGNAIIPEDLIEKTSIDNAKNISDPIKVKIGKMEVDVNKFSMRFNTEFELAPNALKPVGFAKLHIEEYKNHIPKLVETGLLFNRTFGGQEVDESISNESIEKIVFETLEKIKIKDANYSKGDFAILVKSDKSGNVTVSDKQLFEIMGIGMQALMKIKAIILAPSDE